MQMCEYKEHYSLFFVSLLIVIITYVHLFGCVCYSTCMEVRGQLVRVGGTWDSNSVKLRLSYLVANTFILWGILLTYLTVIIL